VTRARTWAWAAVGAAAGLIGVSFALSSHDAASDAARGPRAAPVGVAGVSRGALTERGRYPGELDADAADVSAFYAGRVTAVHVRVGDAVKKGDVLAEVDPVDAREQISAAQAQARAAAAEEKRARVEHAAAAAESARMEKLADRQIISELEIENLRARAAALRAGADAAAAAGAEARARVALLEKRVVESKVRAPLAGRVAARHVDPGAIVTAGAPLVRVVAVEPLRVRFQVPEQDVGRVETGAEVRVVTDPSRGPAPSAEEPEAAIGVAARVTGVAGEVDRERRVVFVEAVLHSPPAFWLPGMFAEVIATRRTLADATLVPGVAILSRLQASGATETGLFVVDGGAARWVPARVLARDGDRAAVEASLAPDARVIVAGHVDLADGNPVQVAGGG
jgi:RND family efflux transporter MFP subunit